MIILIFCKRIACHLTHCYAHYKHTTPPHSTTSHRPSGPARIQRSTHNPAMRQQKRDHNECTHYNGARKQGNFFYHPAPRDRAQASFSDAKFTVAPFFFRVRAVRVPLVEGQVWGNRQRYGQYPLCPQLVHLLGLNAKHMHR